ncbi:uncharacterized protein LOC144614194 [Panthera onca]
MLRRGTCFRGKMPTRTYRYLALAMSKVIQSRKTSPGVKSMCIPEHNGTKPEGFLTSGNEEHTDKDIGQHQYRRVEKQCLWPWNGKVASSCSKSGGGSKLQGNPYPLFCRVVQKQKMSVSSCILV